MKKFDAAADLVVVAHDVVGVGQDDRPVCAITEPSVTPHHLRSDSTRFPIPACVMHTPLGLPVDPDVWMM